MGAWIKKDVLNNHTLYINDTTNWSKCQVKCTSRIVKVHKKANADSVWPETAYGPNDKAANLPICGGTLRVVVRAESDSNYGCCSCSSYPVLRLEVTCTKCKSPYFPGRLQLQDTVECNDWDITELLDKQ